MAKRIKTKKKKTNKASLKSIRERLQKYVDEANARVEALAESNIYSPALERAATSQLSRFRGDPELFNVQNKKRYTEIVREAGRLMSFLKDETSSLAGANRFAEKSRSIALGQLGNQWREKTGGLAYNPEKINPATLQIAGSIYRMLEEEYSRLFVGAIQYGSENLITQIYDYVQDQPFFADEETIKASAMTEFRQILDEYEYEREHTRDVLKDTDDLEFLEGFSKARNAKILRKLYW